MALYVYAAFLGNFLIAVSKFVAGFLTGSSAMLSEGLHSLSDTSNQILLAFGIRRSKRDPDPEHPFGYSKVQFFWALIVSILIFGLAGSLSFIHGIDRLTHPHVGEEQSFLASYVVLILSYIFEGFALFMAYRELQHLKHLKGYSQISETLENIQNPALLTCLVEDSLAMIGITIALVATLLTDFTHDPVWDGLGSLLIGLVLMVVALLLARENKSYLIGKAVNHRDKQKIKEIIETSPHVKRMVRMQTMLLGPEDMILSLEVDFGDDLTVEGLEKAVDDIEQRIIASFPVLTPSKIFIEPN